LIARRSFPCTWEEGASTDGVVRAVSRVGWRLQRRRRRGVETPRRLLPDLDPHAWQGSRLSAVLLGTGDHVTFPVFYTNIRCYIEKFWSVVNVYCMQTSLPILLRFHFVANYWKICDSELVVYIYIITVYNCSAVRWSWLIRIIQHSNRIQGVACVHGVTTVTKGTALAEEVHRPRVFTLRDCP
jgi:hypothetical protein